MSRSRSSSEDRVELRECCREVSSRYVCDWSVHTCVCRLGGRGGRGGGRNPTRSLSTPTAPPHYGCSWPGSRSTRGHSWNARARWDATPAARVRAGCAPHGLRFPRTVGARVGGAGARSRVGGRWILASLVFNTNVLSAGRGGEPSQTCRVWAEAARSDAPWLAVAQRLRARETTPFPRHRDLPPREYMRLHHGGFQAWRGAADEASRAIDRRRCHVLVAPRTTSDTSVVAAGRGPANAATQATVRLARLTSAFDPLPALLLGSSVLESLREQDAAAPVVLTVTTSPGFVAARVPSETGSVYVRQRI